MFQIFAARMFEQRVLTAYREKVAAERQAKLIEELADEEGRDAQREAKKHRDAQKRREKKQQQKQAKAEDKARKDAERAAEEEAARKLEAEKQEEAKRKREEAKKKKEAERKAAEAEKARKEADRLKRQQDERDKQHAIERKARELKAQKEKAKEDARKKAQEEQEARERESNLKKERKAEADKERRARDDKIKADKAAQKAAHDKVQADKAAQRAADKALQEKASEKLRRDTKRSIPATSVAVPPLLQRNTSTVASPHIPVATPALPKAPTPVRKAGSQQDSKGSSPKTPSVFTNSGRSASPLSSNSQQIPLHAHGKSAKPSGAANLTTNFMSPSLQPSSLHNLPHPPGLPPIGFGPPPGLNGFAPARPPPGFGELPPRNGPGNAMYQNTFPHGGPYPLNTMPLPPPGLSGPPGRAFGEAQMPSQPYTHPPGLGPLTQDAKAVRMPQHGRNISGPSFENNLGQPVQRPAPIGRPGSVKPLEGILANLGLDDSSQHLGSSALLDDEADSLPGSAARGVTVPSNIRGPTSLANFGGFPVPNSQNRIDPFSMQAGNTPGTSWSTPAMPFGNSMSPANTWSQADRNGWPSNAAKMNAPFGNNAASQSRSRINSIRSGVCQLFRTLIANKQLAPDGSLEMSQIHQNLRHVYGNLSLADLMAYCEIEGSDYNGGANFEIQNPESGDHARVFFIQASNAGQDGFGGGFSKVAAPIGEMRSPNQSRASSIPMSNGPIGPPGLLQGLGANMGPNGSSM